MDAFDSWESYLYPAPHEATLRNLYGERDPGVLSRLEFVETLDRQRELLSGEVEIDRTYDATHLTTIHRHLFADVYAWAGQYRTVALHKGAVGSFAAPSEIPRYLRDVHRLVSTTTWQHLELDAFAAAAATVFAYLNQAHPFREGNGRTAKVFMEHVAQQSPFTLDFTQVSPEVWNQRSMLSGPDRGTYEPVPDLLVPVFRDVAAARDEQPHN